MSHSGRISDLVALNTVGADGRTLLGIELPELNTGIVAIAGHLSTQGIELDDEV